MYEYPIFLFFYKPFFFYVIVKVDGTVIMSFIESFVVDIVFSLIIILSALSLQQQAIIQKTLLATWFDRQKCSHKTT